VALSPEGHRFVNVSIDSPEPVAVTERPSPTRTSQILRGILTNNAGVKTFSVQRILSSIGHDRFETSLMMFSLPAIVPVAGSNGLIALPTGFIGGQLAAGHQQIKLPPYILKKAVSRKALAVAIHAILPALEAAEKVLKPRWSWIENPIARRAIGLFVFVLALAIAYPLFGFNALHATSIFVMALGMAEQDGLAVLIGAAVGLISLVILAATGSSVKALRSQTVQWLRKMGRKLGLTLLAQFLARHGYDRLARVLTLQWGDWLLLWDPERTAPRRPRPVTAGAPPAGHRRRPAQRLPTAARAGVAAAVAPRSSATRGPVRRRAPAPTH
jgi:hypothetical protein